jgi:hypothetical protein
MLAACFLTAMFQICAQNRPVAVNDNFIPVTSGYMITFNLLINDYDPDGDLIRIKEVIDIESPLDTLIFTDSSFTVYVMLCEHIY